MTRQVRAQTQRTGNRPIRRARGSAWTALALLLAWLPTARADWLTYRGNPQRTGNIDGQPGPQAPKILWAYRSQEHFVASPVPGAKALYVPGLGAFNTGVFHSLAMEAGAPRRVLWSKLAPYVKRPTVCAPAVADGLIVFGDGMHQTDDAWLYCLQADSGRPVWQLPVPGRLVHVEASPTIDKARVYAGGGDAGIFCVALDRVTLDGKEHDLATVKALVEKRWAELIAKYEEDKKKDPDFAIPPSEDALPKPAPKLLWHRGQGKWHVDAPLAVTGDLVLAASAYLDLEKVGDRSLLCLKASDGSLVWRAPLKVNPWAGPTVAGNLVLVGCSNIRFDMKRIKQARGEVVAVDLARGQVKWRRAVPGGILSPIAVKDGLAVFTATDGKVRAWKAATGGEKWAYDGPNPFFAGPAVAGGMVYAADLKGLVHAIRLADGKRQWTLDIPADPAIQSPGMVYGSPAIHGGRIYVATCNLEGEAAGQPSAVVCIADKSVAAQVRPALGIAVDKEKRTVTIPCRIAPRKLPTLKDIYPIEVIATHPSPQGQKAHETVVTFEARPSEVHKALEALGLKPGKPARGEEGTASGPEVQILLELPGADEKPRLIPVEKTLADRDTGKPMPALKWLFTGSVLRKPDPAKEHRVYGADLTGTLIAVFPVTDETVFQSNLTMKEEMLLNLETNRNVLPAVGTAAKLIIAAPAPGRQEARPAARPEALGAAAGPVLAFAPLPPFVTAPQPSRLTKLISAPSGLPLPVASVRQQPYLLASERHCPVRQRPAADLPPLASRSPSRLPRHLLVGPLARAPAPDPGRLPVIGTPQDPSRFSLASDPTSERSRQAALAIIPRFRQSPAPFLCLVIPDPFALITILRLRHPPPDDDPPAYLPDLPPKPRLPTKP